MSIRWGIDLGTTNSVLAVLDGEQVRVIPSRYQEPLTPSAVYFYEGESGRVESLVGKQARSKRSSLPGQVALEFKQKMGNPDWAFATEKPPHTEPAVALSARVLKELRNSVPSRSHLGPMHAAVITVPAAFQNPARDDTIRAGHDADIGYVELLPEPVAAALAYGRLADTRHKPIWLAYDLGGGTFDAALVQGEDGVFTIRDHEGDRHLGGKDLDEAIVADLIRPKLPEALQARVVPWGDTVEWYILKAAAEDAKIALSRDERVRFEAEMDGKPIVHWIRREEVDALQLKLFGRTVEMCRKLLARNGLAPRDIEKVILVGGPTLSPFLRAMLKTGVRDPSSGRRVDGLNIPLDDSVNPMTAVAEGAAVYAASRSIPGHVAATFDLKANAGAIVAVDLVVPAQTSEADVLVAGTVRAIADGVVVDSRWAVVIERLQKESTAWASPPVGLSATNKFTTRIPLNKGANAFRVGVQNAARDPVAVEHDRFDVHRGISVGVLVLPRGIGVADRHGRTVWFFHKGDGLPARNTLPFSTTTAVEKGRTGSAIVIPVVEGADEKANLNAQIYELQILPEHVPTTIPAGSHMLVTVAITESQEITVTARLEDYGISVSSVQRPLAPDPADIRKTLERDRSNLELFRRVGDDDPAMAAVVQQIDQEGVMASVEQDLEDGSRNSDLWSRAADRTLDVARTLNPHLEHVDELLAWQVHRAYCDRNVDKASEIVRETTGLSDTWRSGFDGLMHEYREACAARDRERANNIAYTRIPEHFETDAQLRVRVGGGAVAIGEAAKTSREAERAGTLELHGR